MKNIYLAAPFFSDQQIENRDKVQALLNANSTVGDIFIPGKHNYDAAEFGSLEWQLATFKDDTNQINCNDVVVAILDYDKDDQSDPGTIWECGYAYANNIPVVAVKFSDSKNLNLMLSMGTTALFNGQKDVENIRDYDFNLLMSRILDVDVF